MSEYYTCPKCKDKRENQCACDNSYCSDYEGCRTCGDTRFKWIMCSACNGSGEGMADRSRCLTCNGKGNIKVDCECV